MGGRETEAIPKGRAEKIPNNRKERKDVAAQKTKAEDGAVIMDQKSCRNKAKQAQKPEKEQQQKLAKEALAKPSDKEDAVEAMKVHAPVMFEKSGEANSSCPLAFTHTGRETEAIPKGRTEKTVKKTKKGEDLAVQKAKAEDGVVIMNQKPCRNKAKHAQKPNEEQQQKLAKDVLTKPLDKEDAVEAMKVHAPVVLEKGGEANSSCPPAFTHTDGEKEAIPKGRAEKTSKKTKKGKEVAAQKAEAEDGVVIVNQKSCRNKAKQAQKPEEEQQQKLAQKVLAMPSDTEGAAAAIQSAWTSRQERTLNAKKVKAQIVVDNSFEASSSVPQTFTHTGREKKAIPKGRAEKTTKKKKGGKDLAVQTAEAEDAAVIMNQKSCRNKAKQAQKPEEEQQQRLAKEALAKPSNKEDAVEAMKVHAP